MVKGSSIQDFEDKVNAVLKGSLKDNPPLLAAVSGGADSMAMLAALCSLSLRECLIIHVVHVEHGIRSPHESQGDAQFVRDFCEKSGITCSIVSIKQGKVVSFAKRQGIGIEAAARFFRRRALFRKAKELGKNTRILIAHTKDDSLELSLMRALRGAGPCGLASMPVNRRRILRPLLVLTRAEVTAYLKEKNIPWREDSTNTDDKFLRNRVRRRLIPLLNEFFPFWQNGLYGMAQTQSFAASFLTQETNRRVIWENQPNTQSYTQEEYFSLSTDKAGFFNQPLIIREEAVFQGIIKINSLAKAHLKSSSLFPAPRRRCSQGHSIKRSVVRKFCQGNIKTADFGRLRLKLEGGEVVLSLVRRAFSECGFSLLIK